MVENIDNKVAEELVLNGIQTKFRPLLVYRVTRETDGTVAKGDLVWFSPDSLAMNVVGDLGGWIEETDMTENMLAFGYERAYEYLILKDKKSEQLWKRKDIEKVLALNDTC